MSGTKFHKIQVVVTALVNNQAIRVETENELWISYTDETRRSFQAFCRGGGGGVVFVFRFN